MIFSDNQVIYYVKHGLVGQSQVLLVLFIYNSRIHFFALLQQTWVKLKTLSEMTNGIICISCRNTQGAKASIKA